MSKYRSTLLLISIYFVMCVVSFHFGHLLDLMLRCEKIRILVSLVFENTNVLVDNFKIVGMLIFPILAYFFTFVIFLPFIGSNYLDKSAVNLNSKIENSTYRVFEYILWGRGNLYRNSTSGNLIFFTSLYTVSVFFIITMTIIIVVLSLQNYTIELATFKKTDSILSYRDVILVYLSLVTIVSTLFWYERNKYKEKWDYLCNIYNEYLKVFAGQKFNSADLFSNALAIDAIVTMMWNHRSFSTTVKCEILKAFKCIVCSYDEDDIINKLNTNYFSETEILYVLEVFHYKLLEMKCCEKCDPSSIDRCINIDNKNWMSNHKCLCLKEYRRFD